MKRKILNLMLFLLPCALAAGCQKEPSDDDPYGEYTVYTAHDSAADLQDHHTYFLPDSILLIGKTTEPRYWKDSDAARILARLEQNFNAAGYTRTRTLSEADLGLQPSYVYQVTYYAGWDSPFWWWDYPFYWDPGYWGDWFDWYSPYVVTGYYTAGTLLVELLDLRPAKATDDLPVVWDALMGGNLSGSPDHDTERMLRALDQAMTQSPYLNR